MKLFRIFRILKLRSLIKTVKLIDILIIVFPYFSDPLLYIADYALTSSIVLKDSKCKYLESKDIIDIAIVSKLLPLGQIVELIEFLCDKLHLYQENEDTILPISIYKVLIFHEYLDLFDYFYTKEHDFPQH